MAPPPFQRPSAAAVGLGGALSAAVTTPNSTQLQQRAAAAAQFLAVERKISSREIQAMLEKNEAALRGWRGLQRQEPPKQNVAEHSEWVKRCMRLRQQIGARLEVLASLADKQIAQEDASDQQGEVSTAPSSSNNNSSGGIFPVSQDKPIAVGTVPVTASDHINQPPAQKQSHPPLKAAPGTDMTPPNVFPDAPMPTSINTPQYGYTSDQASAMVNPGMFYPPSQSAPMAVSSQAFMPTSSTSMVMQGFPAMSGGPTFANNSYMSSANPTSQSNAFLNQQQQALMMGASAAATIGMNMASNMMGVPPYMAMAMQNNQVAMNMVQNPAMFNPAAVGMYANANNGFSSMNTSQLPVDPFNAGMGAFPVQPGFQQPVFNAGVVSTGFDQFANPQSTQMMNGFSAMQDQQQMMMNAYAYGMGVAPQQQQQQQYMQSASTGVFPAGQPPPPQQQQQSQQQQLETQQQAQQSIDQQQTSGLSDSDQALFNYSDSNMNLFDEFPEDAFLEMQ